MIAAGHQPDRFLLDPVFSDPQNYAFYVTISRPWVAFNFLLTGDIGQAYMLMQFPILFLQTAGFYLLGRRLFGGCFWPMVLALLSIPPVFIFNGELWGNLPAPLTRSIFGALYPFLLLSALPPFRGWRAFLTMGLCGLSVYIHPVSAPSVALTLWLAMAISPQQASGWSKKLGILVGAGLFFLAIAAPFALMFLSALSHATSPMVTQLQESSRGLVGEQYYDAMLALSIAAQGGGNNPLPDWGWLHGLWAAAFLFLLAGLSPRRWQDTHGFLLLILLGTLLSSFGVAWLDQTIARHLGRNPAEIDIIRNLRFVIPVALIGLVWLLKWLEMRFYGALLARYALPVMGLLLLGFWWHHFPNPLYAAIEDRRQPDHARQQASATEEFRTVIERLRQEPPGSLVLPLPVGAFETNALAVRYGAFQPVLFLQKDMNFLLYSSSQHLEHWAGMRDRLSSLDTSDAPGIRSTLNGLKQTDNLRLVLVDTQAATPRLATSVAQSSDLLLSAGRWQLFRLKN